MAHTVEIKEIINGVQITETIDADVVVKLISYQSKPFLRTTNESSEETYQVLDIVGEIYNTPALATDFRIIAKNGAVFIPANGIELIEYSKKIRAFRPDDDGFSYHIGEITGTSNSITIGLADDNVNWAYIDGSFFEKYYPDTFNFTPVNPGETKTFLIYAQADSQTFYLTQSTGIPPGTYLIASVTVNEAGIDIIQATSGFREKSVDNFAIYSLLAGDRVIGIDANMRLKVQSSGAVRIGGFVNEEDKLYNGCPISVRNDTPFPMEFYNAVDASPEFIAINSADLPFSIKPGETANFAYRGGGIVEIIKTGGGGASFPEGTNGQILELDSTAPEGVKWVDKIKGVAASFLHYWNGSTWLSSGVEWVSAGIIKVKSVILTTNSGTALPDELGYDGTNVFFGNTKRKLRYNDSTVFTYTPTGNFTISQIRTAMEAAGYVFNDSHINIQLGSNNYTCTIDIGVSHPYRIFTMDRNGTGSISFLSTRTLNSGADSITIMNGNEFSRAIIKTGTSVDFLKIRNE